VSAGGRFNTYGGSVTQARPAAVNGKRGIDALRDPATNKSTAFTEAEREGLGLTGEPDFLGGESDAAPA
jgi:hypothetical protein